VRGWRAALVAILVVAACGPGDTTPADVTPDPQSATINSGRFQLAFTVDRTTLRSGDDITGLAELRMLVAGVSGAISGPDDTIAFEFVEIGGKNRRVLPAADTGCSPHQVGSDTPMRTPLYKSGGPGGGDPDPGWVTEFLRGSDIHLPAGEWDITAVATFVDGKQCQGQQHAIRATIRVRVTG
jgi:hypothetical protein